MKNAITDNYFEFSNISEAIKITDQIYKKKFFEKHGFHKTKDMCWCYHCPNKAKYVLIIPFFQKFIRFFQCKCGNTGVKSCGVHFKGYCKNLETPREYWKELIKKGGLLPSNEES